MLMNERKWKIQNVGRDHYFKWIQLVHAIPLEKDIHRKYNKQPKAILVKPIL